MIFSHGEKHFSLAIESLIGASVRSPEGASRIGAFLEGPAAPIVAPGLTHRARLQPSR